MLTAAFGISVKFRYLIEYCFESRRYLFFGDEIHVIQIVIVFIENIYPQVCFTKRLKLLRYFINLRDIDMCVHCSVKNEYGQFKFRQNFHIASQPEMLGEPSGSERYDVFSVFHTQPFVVPTFDSGNDIL